MPPKRKTLAQNNQAPQRSSVRLRNKMSSNATATNEKVPIDLSTPTPPPENKKKKRVVTNKKPRDGATCRPWMALAPPMISCNLYSYIYLPFHSKILPIFYMYWPPMNKLYVFGPPHNQMLAPSLKKPTSSGPEGQEKVDDTPIRHHLIVTKEEDVKRFEEVDDCFILGFDPIDPVNLQNLSVADKAAESPDFAIVAEKGKVACRDYPHSRHLCIKFPFKTTPHEKYCELCYCYVCDTAAPCLSWSLSSANACLSHCNASENTANWKQERLLRKQLSTMFKK